jgi:localization factor PodJL
LIEAQRDGAGLETGGTHDVAAIADLVAERVAATSPRPTSGAAITPLGEAADVGELSQAIKDFMRENRSEGEHSNAVLDTMQQTIIRVLDRMEALEQGAGRAGNAMTSGMHSAAHAAAPNEEATAATPQYEDATVQTGEDQKLMATMPEAAVPVAKRPGAKGVQSSKTPDSVEDEIAIDRLQRAVGKLDEAGPSPTPARAATPKSPVQRSRADFIAAARQAAARANNPPPVDEIDEAPVAERSRFAAAARKAAGKVTRRKINDDELDGGEIDATEDGFSLGGMEAETREVAKTGGRSRILFAAIALVAVGLGATKLVMSLSSGAPPKQLQSNGMQQGSNLAGEKPEFAPRPQKVGEVVPPQSVPAGLVQPATADQVTYQPAEATAAPSGELTHTASLAPQDNQPVAGSAVSGAGESTSRQSLPPALIGPLSLRLAAANGDASAEFQVGSRFADGKGIKQDFDAALKWYRRSAGRGFALAQYRLGTLYERGLGVAKDSHRARVWYERAARQDNIKAMHNLAVLAAGSGSGKPDYDTAARWFAEAAERGLADSQFNLAILYQNGLGVPMDESLAYKWFSLAASSGDKEAAKRQQELAGKLGKAKAGKMERELRGWMRKPSSQIANDPHFAGQAWQRS